MAVAPSEASKPPGVIVDNKLNFSTCVANMLKITSRRLYLMCKLRTMD